MGEFTEFYLAVNLKPDLPQDIVKILSFLTSNDEKDEQPDDEIERQNHPFFKTRRWSMLCSCSDSPSFPGESYSSFKHDCGYYQLFIRSAIKEYDNEYEKFLAWIEPYVADYNNVTLGHVNPGTHVDEIYDIPALILNLNKRIYIVYIDDNKLFDLCIHRKLIPNKHPTTLEIYHVSRSVK